MRIIIVFVSLLFVLCTPTREIINSNTEKPNILWIVCEDISPTLSFYGDSTAKTPFLDNLASESVVYENVFATVGVCAPSRSSIITGKYPTSIGTMHMRTAKDITSWGKRKYKKETGRQDVEGQDIIEYSAVVPEDVKCFSEYMRAAGYYCTNNQKTDYQFAAPLSAWDENDNKAHWRNCPEGQAFFSVFNFNVTHESKLWKHEDKKLTVDPAKVVVPPYLPDTEKMRHTIARNYSNIELLDKQVGKILNDLKSDGLYGNTIIFFYSDHGGPLPRQKREAYDSGLRVPFMVKHLQQKKIGRNEDLISFVDLAPTMLDIAGNQYEANFDGYSFWAPTQKNKREYVFGSGDRFDEITDRVRIIRTNEFLYIKNYYPEKTGYKDLAYRKNIPAMPEFLSLKNEGNLDSIEKIWFQEKPTEELYVVSSDPYNIVNVVDQPKYAEELLRHRKLLKNHLSTYGDKGSLPESLLIKSMWPDFQQPTTADLAVDTNGQRVILNCGTPRASISYYISDVKHTNLDRNLQWNLYNTPILIPKGKYLHAVAERIGYKPSKLEIKSF